MNEVKDVLAKAKEVIIGRKESCVLPGIKFKGTCPRCNKTICAVRIEGPDLADLRVIWLHSGGEKNCHDSGRWVDVRHYLMKTMVLV